MRILTIASLVFVVSAVPASAETPSGPFVGAGVTLDNYNGSGEIEGLGGVSGVGGTLFAGYDLPLNPKLFVGVEGNIDLATADATVLGEPVEADWGWGLSGRAGYMINSTTALYARGGYARERAEVSLDNFWLDGIRYGAGLETKLTDKISLRSEFTQFNFEDHVTNNQVQLGLSYRF